MGNIPGWPRVIEGPNLKKRIVALRKRARQLGILQEFDQALETLEQELLTRPLPPDTDPNVFGEPKYTIAPFLICMAVIRPLVVHFGTMRQTVVHHGIPVYPVLIRELSLLT